MWSYIKYWSDAKLAKELAFAEAALDEADEACVAWLRALREEEARRDMDDFANQWEQ